MKFLFLLICISFSALGYSQDVLLKQNVPQDATKPSYGPNLKHFVHAYVGLAFPVATNSQQNFIKAGLSSDVDLGLRYKRRLSNTLALGLDLGINATAYKIRQDDSKTVPDTYANDREKIQVNTAVSAAWFRINVGRRGNYIGNYLDLGAYGGWNYMKKHKTVNINNADEKVKTLTTRLSYVENFAYGLLARLGTSRYALTAKYRASNIFTAGSQLPELPRLMLGVELGMFK